MVESFNLKRFEKLVHANGQFKFTFPQLVNMHKTSNDEWLLKEISGRQKFILCQALTLYAQQETGGEVARAALEMIRVCEPLSTQ